MLLQETGKFMEELFIYNQSQQSLSSGHVNCSSYNITLTTGHHQTYTQHFTAQRPAFWNIQLLSDINIYLSIPSPETYACFKSRFSPSLL